MGENLEKSETSGILKIRVIPRAKTNEIVDVLQDGIIKIRLVAPPVNGKANKSLKIFLSSILNIQRSRIEIISGAKGRDKIIRVDGMDQESINARIAQELG
ncbi:MAG: DUF167 domain-containing protein [Chloroflexota bacterium]|nr:MAG: DUF167 domain-containing protein [Chloroflexota bacterium]